jgi:hypothetical protein
MIAEGGSLCTCRKQWFDDLSIEHTADGQTILRGAVVDQSALYGLIERLSSLGLQLISVAVTAVLSATEEVGHV